MWTLFRVAPAGSGAGPALHRHSTVMCQKKEEKEAGRVMAQCEERVQFVASFNKIFRSCVRMDTFQNTNLGPRHRDLPTRLFFNESLLPSTLAKIHSQWRKEANAIF